MEATINSEPETQALDRTAAEGVLPATADTPINWRRLLIRPLAALGFAAAMGCAAFAGSQIVFILALVQGLLWLVLFCSN